MKTHWLFGRGPDKLLDFKREVDEETDCTKCIHREVCDLNMEKRCENYVFGSSQWNSCQSCLHKYTRYDKDPVPCFSCPWFEKAQEAPINLSNEQLATLRKLLDDYEHGASLFVELRSAFREIFGFDGSTIAIGSNIANCLK